MRAYARWIGLFGVMLAGACMAGPNDGGGAPYQQQQPSMSSQGKTDNGKGSSTTAQTDLGPSTIALDGGSSSADGSSSSDGGNPNAPGSCGDLVICWSDCIQDCTDCDTQNQTCQDQCNAKARNDQSKMLAVALANCTLGNVDKCSAQADENLCIQGTKSATGQYVGGTCSLEINNCKADK